MRFIIFNDGFGITYENEAGAKGINFRLSNALKNLPSLGKRFANTALNTTVFFTMPPQQQFTMVSFFMSQIGFTLTSALCGSSSEKVYFSDPQGKNYFLELNSGFGASCDGEFNAPDVDYTTDFYTPMRNLVYQIRNNSICNGTVTQFDPTNTKFERIQNYGNISWCDNAYLSMDTNPRNASAQFLQCIESKFGSISNDYIDNYDTCYNSVSNMTLLVLGSIFGSVFLIVGCACLLSQCCNQSSHSPAQQALLEEVQSDAPSSIKIEIENTNPPRPKTFRERLIAINIDPAQDDTLKDYICPIIQEIPDKRNLTMLVGDGRYYDRNAITQWLNNKRTSPVTRERLNGTRRALTLPYNAKDKIETRITALEMQFHQHEGVLSENDDPTELHDNEEHRLAEIAPNI